MAATGWRVENKGSAGKQDGTGDGSVAGDDAAGDGVAGDGDWFGDGAAGDGDEVGNGLDVSSQVSPNAQTRASREHDASDLLCFSLQITTRSLARRIAMPSPPHFSQHLSVP